MTRPDVRIDVPPDEATSGAAVTVQLDAAAIAAPTPRTCVAPWDFLNEVAAEEAGIEDLDLQAQLVGFLPAQFRSRLDPDPILNCYDPLDGPAVEETPGGQRIEQREDLLLPFYGTISVGLDSTAERS